MSAVFHAGTDWHVRCSTYPDATPLLSLDGGRTSIMISTTRRAATIEGVEFARELVKQAQRYAAEMERMHAEHLDPAADSNAA